MIPSWNLAGLLPPIWPGEQGHSDKRSPYASSLIEVVDRFGTSPERVIMLRGLLDYRAALYAFDVVDGFQWLDGSFMQDIEALEDRSPNDIDVVTYFRMPEGETQASLLAKARHLFSTQQTKATFRVDAYAMVLDEPMNDANVQRVAYWYSMWSHTRTESWKGFIVAPLDPVLDQAARHLLEGIQFEEAAQ